MIRCCASVATTTSSATFSTPFYSAAATFSTPFYSAAVFCSTAAATKAMTVKMRDRSKNRKPLQKGRNLSIEAIQTIQALKRAYNNNKNNNNNSPSITPQVEEVFRSKFRRLLKFDMVAVLRDLLRQNHCLLALLVFEDVRKEYWYKPQVSLYAEMISILGNNGFIEEVESLFMVLKMESGLEPDIQGFNALLKSLMNFNLIRLAMECFYLMKSIECEPDKVFFRTLIQGLELKGETGLSAIVRQEAQKIYGKSLSFLEEDEMAIS